MSRAVVTERAPAKLNLTLRILGRRADGYHTLESLVSFAYLHDMLYAEYAEELSLTADGEFAADAGAGEQNLVLKAARALRAYASISNGAAIALTKNIPVGAGLGGGSADAAATLRALNRLWELNYSMEELTTLATPLGADVAMCIASRPTTAHGIGELLSPLQTPLPYCYALLVYPRVKLLTSDVYRALAAPPLGVLKSPIQQSVPTNYSDFIAYLQASENDLELAARRICPEVSALLEALTPHADFVRMSGSGACCYALYETKAQADAAAEALRAQHAEWWVTATSICR